MSDLLERLREKWCGHSGLHELHHVNPDGPEAADEIERLREALKGVEDWWLRDGMSHFGGAPACIFDVRAALNGETA